MPVKTLKNVVLPAPFGPMIEAICPSSSEKSRAWSAVSPPKRLVTPRASRTVAISAVRGRCVLALASPRGQDALGPEDHHEDEDEAEDHPLVLGGLELRGERGEVESEDGHAGVAQLVEPEREALEDLEVEHGHDGGAEDGARDRAHAAEDHHREYADGLHEREGLGVDEDLL